MALVHLSGRHSRHTCRHLPSASSFSTTPSRPFRGSAVASQAAQAITQQSPPHGPYDVLFCGSDLFATIVLERLLKSGKHTAWSTLTLLTHPMTAKSSRGQVPPAVELATRHGIDVHETPIGGIPKASGSWELPGRFRLPTASNLLVTASFGQMMPNWLLDTFTNSGCDSMALNVHPSMLPDMRGAAPIQWAIARRLQQTGVSIQQLSRGSFDRGQILAQESVDIPEGATYESLLPILAQCGGSLLANTITDLPARHATARTQHKEEGVPAFKIGIEDGEIDWETMSAKDIDARHRAFGGKVPLYSWVQQTSEGTGSRSARTLFRGVSLPRESLTLEDADAETKLGGTSEAPGSAVLVTDRKREAMIVKTKSEGNEASGQRQSVSAIIVSGIQTENKKRMPLRQWWAGQSERRDHRDILRFASGPKQQDKQTRNLGTQPPGRSFMTGSFSGVLTATLGMHDAGRMSLQRRFQSSLASTPISTASMTPTSGGGRPSPRRRGTLAKAIGDGTSWSQLHPAQKVFRTGYKTGQIGLVLGGGLLTGAVLWALLSEMFAPNSPSVIYKDACKRVERCPEIFEHLLPPLSFHISPQTSYSASFSPLNPPTGSRRRSSHLPTSTVITEKSSRGEREVLLMTFFLEARDKDRDWTYLERARQSVSDAWQQTKMAVSEWVESMREERSRESPSSNDSSVASMLRSPTPSSESNAKTPSGPSTFSRFLSSLSPLPSSNGRAKDGARKRREPGTFSAGEVRAELIFDAESGKWQYRKLYVDVPKSGTLGATRVWIVKREGEVTR